MTRRRATLAAATVYGDRLMTDQTKFELLRQSKLSGELDDEQVKVLAEHVTLRDLADDEILCDEGKSDDRVHAIVSGAIAVAKRQAEGGMINLNVLTKGDLVGELAFMDGKPHYAALKAMGPTRVLSLAREDLERMLDTHPRIVYRVMRSIFRVVHTILHRMGAQQSELTNYIYKLHGKY
jgi:CRP/FNR family transcriptional regulator, cyclic AMP receptor protein